MDEKQSTSSGNSPSKSLALVPKSNVSIPISILIEALIQKMCSSYEPDEDKHSKLYQQICTKLHEMGFLNDSWEMEQFASLRQQLQGFLCASLNRNLTKSDAPIQPYLNGENLSYYRNEFEEIKLLGGGGSGKVYRVKHKLDGAEYAIKKVQLRSNRIETVKNYMSEASTFASLNHPNIVPYKIAWMEINWPTQRGISYRRLNSRESTTEESSDSSPKKSEEEAVKSTPKWATLYIQMNLCELTLKQWLDNRNRATDPKTALVPINGPALRSAKIRHIVSEIAKGLQYIHTKGFIHHDIKPSNILIQELDDEILVQVADFGLACSKQSDGHSSQFGTKPYAAPEQLHGKCNLKSDIFSLGIVTFELVENFRTDSERAINITNLKKGIMSSDLRVSYKEFSDMILGMVDKNPDQRPEAATILYYLELNEMKVQRSRIIQLEQEAARKDSEIIRLQELLRLHGISERSDEMELASCSRINNSDLF